MPQTYSIPVETITPIWTGDNNRKTSYLRATSFLGGLRFWTEALLRSFGHEVCDVTNQGCIHDSEKHKMACPGCQIFGCTGLGRSFQMQIVEHKKMMPKNHEIKYRRNQQLAALTSSGLSGQFEVKLTSLRPRLHHDTSFDISYALLGLLLMVQWGALGARDQYGHGFVKTGIGNHYKTDIEAIIEHESKKREQQDQESKGLLFDEFFFFQADNQENSYPLPEKAFHFRAQVRRQFATNKHLRHYFCGSLKEIFSGNQKVSDKAATNYNFALVKNKIFGWGYYPKNGPFGSSRDTCLNALHTKLGEHFSNLSWKEFASPRDNCASPTHFKDYVIDMIKNPWTR